MDRFDVLRRACPVSLILVLATGCFPSQPGLSSWRQDAVKSLDDVHSSLTTAQLVVRLQTRQRLLKGYGTVSLMHAEEAADKAVQTLSTLQPPPGASHEDKQVEDLLEQGADLVRDVRVKAAAHQLSAPGLTRQISEMARKIQVASNAMDRRSQ